MSEDQSEDPGESELESDVLTHVGRRTLDRKQILREAVRLIDEHGRERLTMRRLGGVLGVEAMALYRYVPGREQLLDGVVEYVMNELYEQTMTVEQPNSWQEYLQKMAHGVRDIAVAHPRVFPLVATRPPAAPWLRPPLRSLRWVESFLEGLADFGFSERDSVLTYRAFSTFLLGHLLLESATVDLDGRVGRGGHRVLRVQPALGLPAGCRRSAPNCPRTATRTSSRTRSRT